MKAADQYLFLIGNLLNADTRSKPIQRFRRGPVRIPAIIISPYAKRRFVDHTTCETVSILKLIETRWNLAPLGSRDAAANNLLNAFDFSQTP